MSTHLLDEIWDSAVGGAHWLKSVLFGEFADDRPRSAVTADMLVSFVPGVVIVMSARDAVAVILRLAQHPERRGEAMEWILLAACLITLALPLALAAGGVAAAGVGAIVGGVAGSELGAALRGVMLMLIKEANKLVETLRFLQKFMHGDVLFFLKSIKFAKYEKVLLMAFEKTIGKLIDICRALRGKLEYVSYFNDAKQAISKLVAWEHKFYAVQNDALHQLPRAVAELDARLAPSAQEAYVNGGEIYGLSFPLDGMTLTKPTAADAMGWGALSGRRHHCRQDRGRSHGWLPAQSNA